MGDAMGLPEHISLTDYAKKTGLTYTGIKKRFDKIRQNNAGALEGHYYIEGKRTIKVDPEAIKLLEAAGNDKKESRLIVEDERIDQLKTIIENQKKELDEKDAKLAEIQQMLSSRYILLEDHQKMEEELKKKEEALKEAEKKAEEAEEAKTKVQETYEKNKKLFDYSQKLNADYRKEIDEKNDKLAVLDAEKVDMSSEMEKLREEMAELAKARDEAVRESEENLNLGFFARLRKKKEKKNS